jgi:hypothetical protein
MKYVKHQHDQNWILVTPEQEDDEYLKYHGIWKLIEHEEPHESFDINLWKLVEHLKVQTNFRRLHRIWEVVPIDAYEPDRPTIIDPQENA